MACAADHHHHPRPRPTRGYLLHKNPDRPQSFDVSAAAAAARREPDVLDIGDVSGSRVIETAYLPRVGVRDAHAAAAREVTSRFAIDPRWLLYLPPTMSPVATAQHGDLLEHPDQAVDAYRADGVTSVAPAAAAAPASPAAAWSSPA